jgi:hypothetical protein
MAAGECKRCAPPTSKRAKILDSGLRRNDEQRAADSRKEASNTIPTQPSPIDKHRTGLKGRAKDGRRRVKTLCCAHEQTSKDTGFRLAPE